MQDFEFLVNYRLTRREFRGLLTCSLAIAMALTGCGSDGESGGTSSAALGATATPSPTPTPSPTATPSPTPSPTPTPTATSGPLAAIASNFDTKPLIVQGYDHGIPGNIPPSMAPDVVGAFRFICTAGQLNYDDPVVYPGVAGGSAHLHQFFGNTLTNYQSTYATLRTTGDSTCSNALNRSAYWAPAMMNEAGQVIRPDYLSVYYKRIPASDPMCQKTAAEGCVDLPVGLRIVSGYDMSRMSEAQPENIKFSHACVASPTPRATLAEAVADCGGAGQITTSIFFPNCWDGRLDSPNHRDHLVAPAYIGQAYPQCPADHPKLIPEIFLGLYYTIAKADGAIYFSSDRMNGMTKAGGTTFHSDYMEGWDPTVAATWQTNCINKLLNCSDGELGDGTMLKRGPLTLVASPRTVSAPAR